MKKILIVILFLVMGLDLCFAQPSRQRVAKIVKLSGDVQVMLKKEGSWRPARRGLVLSEGDAIKTGELGSASLHIKGDARGSLVILKENTDLSLDILKEDPVNNKKVTVLDLSIGKILIQAEKTKSGSRFEVKTPTSVVGVRGTKFAVEVDSLE